MNYSIDVYLTEIQYKKQRGNMILKYNPIKHLYFNQAQQQKEKEKERMEKITKYSIKTTSAVHWKAIMAALLSIGFKYSNGDTDLDNIFNTGYGEGFDTYIIIKMDTKTLSCANDCYRPHTDSILTTLEDALKLINGRLNPEPICCRIGIVYPDKVIIGKHTCSFENVLELAEAVKEMQG